MRVSQRVLIAVCALVALSTSSFAATLSKVNDDALEPLRAATVAKKIRLEKLPLYDSKRSVIDLEEFQVWAPDGKVVIHGDNGRVLEVQTPPGSRFYRGLVNGNKDTFAYFSVDVSTGRVDGLIDTSERRVALASVRRAGTPVRNHRTITPDEKSFEYFLSEDDPFTVTPAQTWQCQIDKTKIVRNAPIHASGLDGRPVTANGITGTQSYAITLEIETDYEMFHTVAGDNAGNVTTYITNLTGALAAIYNRDLKTNVTLKTVNVYTTASDPWSATDPFGGLSELGNYYHSPSKPAGRTTSSVVLLSGKAIGGGIAWEGVIGGGDNAQDGTFAGAYAWCGGVGNLFAPPAFGGIPDVNTAPYTMPTGTQNFWPLAEYAHELGHNLGGHHTHCVAVSDAERIASGFTDLSPATSASNQVDHCYAHENLAIPDATGCFLGATDYINGSQGVFKGSLMSYCHNVNAPQATGSRFTFGQATDPSHNELDNYMLRAGGPFNTSLSEGLNGGGLNIVNAVGAFTITAITANASVAPNSTGNVASITASPAAGATYAWQITNGTITSSTTTSSITYSAGPSGAVILRAIAYGTNKVGVTDTKSVSIVAVGFNPPTNVEAHATGTTSALVSWSAPSGTAPGRYNVYRSGPGTFPDYNTFALVGFSATTSFTDNTASPNKAFLYMVRSADAAGANESSDSNRDLVTMVAYTNQNNAIGSLIKAVDMNELRVAVDAVRTLYGIGPGSYGFSPIVAGSTLVRGEDMAELRTNLNTPITGMGFPAPTYTNTITSNGPLVKAIDFNEVRNWMR